MMTDKEFLEGIYEKAEQLKESEPHLRSRSYYHVRRLVPVLAVFFLIIVAFPVYVGLKGSIKREPKNGVSKTALREEADHQMAVPDDGVPKVQGRSAPADWENDKTEPYSITEPIKEAAFVLMGEITSSQLSGNGEDVYMTIIEIYKGQEQSGDILVHFEETEWQSLGSGDIVLVYLAKTDQGYELLDGDNSLYKYGGEDDGTSLFYAWDGTMISAKDLK